MFISLDFYKQLFYNVFILLKDVIILKKEMIKTKIVVQNTPINVIRVDETDFISLTDLAKYQNSSDPSFTVKNWLRKISTIDYRGL